LAGYLVDSLREKLKINGRYGKILSINEKEKFMFEERSDELLCLFLGGAAKR